jgi:hypothetical protein
MLDITVRPTPRPARLPACRFEFPDPARADAEGLLAHGGDLEPATLIAAYRRGVFPWPYDDQPLLWWSPDPRAILPLGALHVSRSLARTLRRGRFSVTVNADFPAVIDGCAARPETWITPAMRTAYVRLHTLGWAHSVEVWGPDGALAAGSTAWRWAACSRPSRCSTTRATPPRWRWWGSSSTPDAWGSPCSTCRCPHLT